MKIFNKKIKEERIEVNNLEDIEKKTKFIK